MACADDSERFGFVICALICRRGYNTRRTNDDTILVEAVTSIMSREIVFINQNGEKEVTIALDEEADDSFAPVVDLESWPRPPSSARQPSLVRFEVSGNSDNIVPLTAAPTPRPCVEPGKSLWCPPQEWAFNEEALQRPTPATRRPTSIAAQESRAKQFTSTLLPWKTR
jgi:hypothetical protein